MKKIFALILCLMLLCATPLVAFAEGETTEEPTTTVEEEISWTTVSDAILDWLYHNYDKALVSLFLAMTALYGNARDKKLNKNMGTLNNNAITVAEKSTHFMTQALSNIENASGVVASYDARIVALLQAFQQTAEDKQRLESELVEIKSYLKTATDANIEFANELAELLGLANIPNYKKEELGARHLKSVEAIIEAEKKAEAVALLPTNTGEVKVNVGEEKEN